MESITEINGGSGTLVFHGTEVKFNPGLFYFAEISHRFAPIIEQCIANVDRRCDKELGDMQSFISNIDGVLGNVFNPLVEFSVKQLSLLGCYDFDPGSFFERYVEPKFGEILKIKKQLISEDNRIDAEQEARNEMRTERRRNAANQYLYSRDRDNSNIIQGGRNLVGWVMDQGKNQAERDRIYGRVKNKVKLELKWICHDMPGSVAQALYKSTGFDIRDPRSPDDYNRAENIFKNIKEGNVSDDRLEQAALDVFSLNPETPGFLQWCVGQYADPDGNFEKAAAIFHIDINETKYEILSSAVNLDTEENALASKKALEELQGDLSFSSPELTRKVEDALIAFDKEARTVSGVEFETREKAAEAGRQLTCLQDIRSSGDVETEDGANAVLAEIEKAGLTVCFAEEAKSGLKQKLVKFDLDARTVCGREYRTREEAAAAREQLHKMEDFLSSGDLKSEDGIKAVLAEFEKAGLDAFFVEDKKRELLNELQRIDLELRTVDGIEYGTREESELARHELAEVRKLSSEYRLDNPELCRKFLDAVASLGLKTVVADKIIAAAEERCAAQKDKLEQIVRKYGISQEAAVRILTRHSILARSGISKLKMFDLIDTDLSSYRQNFNIPEDDIIVGILDIYGSAAQGLVFTDKGIYARHIPFLKSKSVTRFIGFAAGPGLAFLLFMMGEAARSVAFCYMAVFIFFAGPVAMFLLHNKIFSKIDASTSPHFTGWSDVLLELSADKTSLSLSRDNHVLWTGSSANEFPLLKDTVREQCELPR